MVYDGLLWFIMFYYDLSWLIMAYYYGLSWFFMAYHHLRQQTTQQRKAFSKLLKS